MYSAFCLSEKIISFIFHISSIKWIASYYFFWDWNKIYEVTCGDRRGGWDTSLWWFIRANAEDLTLISPVLSIFHLWLLRYRQYQSTDPFASFLGRTTKIAYVNIFFWNFAPSTAHYITHPPHCTPNISHTKFWCHLRSWGFSAPRVDGYNDSKWKKGAKESAPPPHQTKVTPMTHTACICVT